MEGLENYLDQHLERKTNRLVPKYKLGDTVYSKIGNVEPYLVTAITFRPGLLVVYGCSRDGSEYWLYEFEFELTENRRF